MDLGCEAALFGKTQRVGIFGTELLRFVWIGFRCDFRLIFRFQMRYFFTRKITIAIFLVIFRFFYQLALLGYKRVVFTLFCGQLAFYARVRIRAFNLRFINRFYLLDFIIIRARTGANPPSFIPDITRGSVIQFYYRASGGSFAAARFSDQSENFTAADFKRNIVDSFQLTVAHFKILT